MCSAQATIYHTSSISAQEAIHAVQPGDAIVFDGDYATITVNREIRDVQFLGGGAAWNIQSGLIEDCYFFWHNAAVNQTGGQVRRCGFYKSLGQSVFTHIDSVSFYYSGSYIYSKSLGDKPHLLLKGFVRGAFICKPYINQLSYSKKNGKRVHDWEWPHSIVIDATDDIGNGWGSYIMGPIVWEQTNWMPFRVIRGTGITFAHCNTEYGQWSDPICDFDNATRCMLLCNGVGSRGEAHNPYRTPEVIQYPHHVELGHNDGHQPYRGAAFRMAGQMNKSVASGSYKTWSIGLKAWVPGLHYADGVAARDPFFQDWPGDGRGRLSVNFSEPRAVFSMTDDGTYERVGEQRYPLSGADVIRPVIMKMPDLRANPHQIGKTPLTDLSTRTGAQIVTALEAGVDVYLGPGTYDMGNSSLTGGLVVGAGIGKTVLRFSDDASGNRNRGFVNLTVKGGAIGLESNGGILGKTLMRVRFEDISDAALLNGDGGCWQNDIVQGVEFYHCRTGMAMRGSSCPEPFKYDKVDILNCTFVNIAADAISLTSGGDQNGQGAVTNCTFENIGRCAVRMTGGQTHLVQACTIKNSNTSSTDYGAVYLQPSKGATAITHTDVDNSGGAADAPALRMSGDGVISHCSVAGANQAVVTAGAVVDNVHAPEGTISGSSGLFIAKSTFQNVACGIDDNKVVIDNAFTKADGVDHELDQTPPPDVNQRTITVEQRQADDTYPYLDQYNEIRWTGVDDPESGINAYAVYVNGEEIGRTTAFRNTVERFGQHHPQSAATVFRDPNVANNNYVVHPINGANMLPDGSQAPVRKWAPVRGHFELEGEKEFRLDKIEFIDHNTRYVEDTTRNMRFNCRGSDNQLIGPDGSASNVPAKLKLDYGPLSNASGSAVEIRVKAPKPTLANSALLRDRFILPSSGHVQLFLYDAHGRLIATMHNGAAPAGETRFSLSQFAAGAGVYVVTLRTENSSLARSFALLR